MKVGTIAFTEETGIGIYLYPHSKPVDSNTLCSIYSLDKKLIYHLPFIAIDSYMRYCWKCCKPLNSSDHKTCSVCHWIICPDCNVCKKTVCSPDVLQVLDCSDEDSWEEVTGFDRDTFFDGLSGSRYYCLGQEEREEVERCCTALIKRDIRPLLVVDAFDMISLYIENDKRAEAEEVISEIEGNLISLISFDTLEESNHHMSGSCVYCGEPTYDGDTLCPICTNNVD